MRTGRPISMTEDHKLVRIPAARGSSAQRVRRNTWHCQLWYGWRGLVSQFGKTDTIELRCDKHSTICNPRNGGYTPRYSGIHQKFFNNFYVGLIEDFTLDSLRILSRVIPEIPLGTPSKIPRNPGRFLQGFHPGIPLDFFFGINYCIFSFIH